MTTLTVVGTGSSGNCYILENLGQKLILDAGRPIKEVKQALKFNVRNIEGVIISHRHRDHSEYAKDFEKMGIPVWKPYEKEEQSQLRAFGNYTVRSIPLRSQNGWCHTNSDGTECPVYAFIILIDDRRILYMTDFLYSPYTFKNFGLTDIIIEGHHCEGDLNEDAANFNHTVLGHPEIKVTRDIVQINQTKTLRFVGLVHSSSVANKVQLVGTVKEVVNEKVDVELAEKGDFFYL